MFCWTYIHWGFNSKINVDVSAVKCSEEVLSQGKGEMDPGVKFRLYVGNRRLEGNTWLYILWNLRQYLPMTWGWWCWTGSFVSSLHFKLNQAYFHFLLKSFDLNCIPSPHARPMIFYFLLQCEWVCVAVRKQDLGFSRTPFPFKDISFTFYISKL